MTLNMISAEAGCFTAYANAAIDAGAFVKSVSSNDVVTSSGLSTYVTEDIKVEEADDASTDYTIVIGLAGADAAAAAYLPVYTQGLFIVRAGEAVAVGGCVQVAEDTDEYEVDALDSTYGEHKIGRALTGASAADAYLIILLRI